MYLQDEWPKIADGSPWNGKDLLELVRGGESPFADVWDVNLLITEIEENVGKHVVDIPLVNCGSNNYVSLAIA